MNLKIKKILSKKNNNKIVALTAYSKSIAKILDKYCDIILVGDSMANVLYGQKNTHIIKIQNIIEHSLSVKQGVRKSLMVVDMPIGTYNTNNQAFKNARLIMNKTRCDAVKLEDYKNNHRIIKYLIKKKIPVMGHIGYTPQFKKKFKLEGQSRKELDVLLNQAKLIENSGAFAIVLECLTSKAAKIITDEIKIPTIGIGSSSYCDGQILVTDDMLGLSGFYPKFVKRYAKLDRIIEKAVKKYSREVKIDKFPSKKHNLNGK
mgnify:CR=1 FL=1|tara:strand:- start:2126 stop:2908 length:783 start_codon:yes stop_codon:yes gene_type:complete